MDTFSKVFLILSAAVGVIISRGFAVSLMWNMFVPQMFGLPALPILLAIALSSLLSTIHPLTHLKREESPEEGFKVAFGLLITSFLAPWVGYLVVLVATSLYF